MDQLAPMTRAVLPGDLASRDRISRAQADRFSAIGMRWAKAGFTDRAARQWRLRDIGPDAASFLALRGVTPELIDQELSIDETSSGTGAASAAAMITELGWETERVYERLVMAGHHVPVNQPEPVLAAPTARPPATSTAPQVNFSSPGAEGPIDAPIAASRRRRHAKRHQARNSTEWR